MARAPLDPAAAEFRAILLKLATEIIRAHDRGQAVDRTRLHVRVGGTHGLDRTGPALQALVGPTAALYDMIRAVQAAHRDAVRRATLRKLGGGRATERQFI